MKKNLSPTWNAHFELDVHSTEIQNLVIRVFDEDLTSADDELSVLQLSLQSLPANKRVEDWYKLTFPAGKHLSTGPGACGQYGFQSGTLRLSTTMYLFLPVDAWREHRVRQKLSRMFPLFQAQKLSSLAVFRP